MKLEMEIADRGRVVFEFYADKAPKTVEQIAGLAQRGFYDDQIIHRVENWVVQWGDPNTKDVQKRHEWGTGGSGQPLPYENNDEKMTRGVLAMASTGERVGGDSQMFVLKTDVAGLEGKYCAFGRVVEGMDVVDSVRSGDKVQSMKPIEPDN